MRKTQKYTAFLLILAVTLVSIIPALAAPLAEDPTSEPLALCPGSSVAGTVVAVDPATGMVTVQLSDGTQCTVNITVDESHPIVQLLGQYFGDLSASTLEGALTDSQGCALFDGTAWSWAECGTEGAVPVKVTAYDPVTGTFTAVAEDGTLIEGLTIADPEDSAKVQGALETLAVDWLLEGDGDMSQVSDQIAAYHADGMGFGVLVKLYAIAQESAETCATATTETPTTCPTVEELVALFQSGVGMGQIFKDYGKPDKLGVGHVRQEVNGKVTGNDKEKHNNGKNKTGDTENNHPSADKKDKSQKGNNGLKGVCNAVSKHGKPKAGVTCP